MLAKQRGDQDKRETDAARAAWAELFSAATQNLEGFHGFQLYAQYFHARLRRVLPVYVSEASDGPEAFQNALLIPKEREVEDCTDEEGLSPYLLPRLGVLTFPC